MASDGKIGIIGCGNMGEAIVKGIVFAGIVNAADLYLYDIDKDKTRQMRDYLDVNVANSAEELCNQCNVILLALKPQDMEEALQSIWHVIDLSKLLISVAAGVTITKMKKHLKEEVRIIRVMPNMAAFVRASISAMCTDSYATPDDKKLVKDIFTSIGEIVEVEERLMDIVTAISGSGPAYFFYLTEMLEKCAIVMGMDSKTARLLAVKTAVGSALLLADGEDSAETLRKRVTSKGGTTEAAFRYFGEKKLEDILKEGIEAARKRAKELSGEE
ncbi:MAG: pyrroline-5-carboxylate reductase [Candidatus Omnitrophota bacterium]|nr:pyrroline-5-carboxylate reductase [Candidatus Omnitrophota bacterium]